MTLTAILLTLAYGGVAGLVAGLVGIGGGALLVPYLYLLLSMPEWAGISLSPAEQAVVAPATSLAVVLPTALRGAITYSRMKRVDWRIAKALGVGAVIGALVGSRVAPEAPPEVLRFAFSGLLIFVGLQLALRNPEKGGQGSRSPRDPRLGLLVVVGMGVGAFAVLMGVGGGTIIIPFLIHYLRLPLNQVAATSISVVVFTAAAGTLGYTAFGGETIVTPDTAGLVGYVLLPAALALIPGALIMVKIGAGLNQRLHPALLRRVIGVIFVLISIRVALSAFQLNEALSASL